MPEHKTIPTTERSQRVGLQPRPYQFYASLIADNCSDPIAVLAKDASVEWVNAAFIEQTGYTLEECVGRSPGELLTGPTTHRSTLRELMSARDQKRSAKVELKQYKKSGETYWAEISVTPILDDKEKVTHFLAVVRDVTVRKDLERDRELARQNELLRQAERRILSKTTEWLYAARSLDDLYNVVKLCAPKLMPNTSGALYIYSNSRDVLDLSLSWGSTPSPQHIEPDECWALRRGRSYQYGSDEIEFPCEHFHEDVGSSFCLPLLAHGETIGMLWCYSEKDQTHQELGHERYWDACLMLAEQISLTIANVRLRQELEDRSIKDPLTGLWNRRYFLDCLRREAARANSSAKGFGLISIDVDNFKRFNDHHGHDAGDLVLRRVCEELVATTNQTGIVCRVGGEELAIICPEFDATATMSLANNVCNSVKRMEIVYQSEVLPCVTISAGVSTYPSDHSSIDQLMRNADNALYQAKRTGRDRSVLFEKNTCAN